MIEARWRDVIRCYGIAEHRQARRAMDWLGQFRIGGNAFEEWWALNVGAAGIPSVQIAGCDLDGVPLFVVGESVRILLFEHLRQHATVHRLLDFIACWPDISQVNWGSSFVVADRFAFEVDIHCASERVSNDQRWAREVVGSSQRIHATFEVAITAEHRSSDKVCRS